MRTHIKVVALLNIILGLFGVFGGVMVLLGGTIGSITSGSFLGAIIGTAASALIGICLAALSLIAVLAGFGLLAGKSWARYAIMGLSVFRLLQCPWMTIFGVYSLWVLFNVETARTFSSPTA